MKKYRISSVVLSAFLATQMISPMTSYCISMGEPSLPTDDTKTQYTYNGCVALNPYDIIKVVTPNETRLTLASIHTVYEFDKAPSDEEAIEMFGPVACAICLINEEVPYIMEYSVTKDGVVTKEKANYPAKIKYILDVTTNEIRDYQSNEVLDSLTDSSQYYIGPYGTDPAQYRLVYVMGDMLITASATQGVTQDVLLKTVYGDINGDSKIDLSDLSMLSLGLIGDITLTERQSKCADFNSDGTVNLSDLSRLKQFVSGKDITLGAN